MEDSETVFKIYTKTQNGKPVMLEGKELEDIKRKYNSEVDEQMEDLKGLKQCREQMKILEKTKKGSCKEAIPGLKKKYQEVIDRYKEIGYKDKRKYSTQN